MPSYWVLCSVKVFMQSRKGLLFFCQLSAIKVTEVLFIGAIFYILFPFHYFPYVWWVGEQKAFMKSSQLILTRLLSNHVIKTDCFANDLFSDWLPCVTAHSKEPLQRPSRVGGAKLL